MPHNRCAVVWCRLVPHGCNFECGLDELVIELKASLLGMGQRVRDAALQAQGQYEEEDMC